MTQPDKETRHSEEPWSIAQSEIPTARSVYDSSGRYVDIYEKAQLQRIVECINFCAGFDSKFLKEFTLDERERFHAKYADELKAELGSQTLTRRQLEKRFCEGTCDETLELIQSGFPTLTHLCAENQRLRAEIQRIQNEK